MAIVDDATISNQTIVFRILLDGWVSIVANRIRPNSLALLDSNFENSCFISNDQSFTELQRLFPGQPVAGIPVEVLRTNGFVVERRPGECPTDYQGNPDDHVVVGPPAPCSRKIYQRGSQAIVKDTRVIMLRLVQNR